METTAANTIDRAAILALEFRVAALQEQREPWRLSEYVAEPVPWGFFAELAPTVAPLWSDHLFVGLLPQFIGADGSSLPLAVTLLKRNEHGALVLFFAKQRAERLPIDTRVRFVERADAGQDAA